MSNTTTFTGPARVWINGTWVTAEDVRRMALEDPSRAINMLAFTSVDNDMTKHDWIEVGTAEVTITLLPPEDTTVKHVEAIRKQITEVQADAQRKVNALEDRISKLLAITYEEPTHE